MLSALPLECPFCDHANLDGAGARYCNACGSRLLLKLCAECQAVTDQAIDTCHRCGAHSPVPSPTPEAAARAALVRLQQLLGSVPTTSHEKRGPVAAATTSGHTTERMPRPSWRINRSEEPSSSIALQTVPPALLASVVESDGESRRQSIRPKTVAIVSTVLLFAIGGSVYYVYRVPMRVTEPLNATRPNPSSPADSNLVGTPTRPDAQTNFITTTSESPTRTDAVGVGGVDAPGSSMKARQSTSVTTSPVTQRSTPATRADNVTDQAPTPEPPRIATVHPTPTLAAQAKGGEETARAPNPAATKPPVEQTRPSLTPVTPAPPATGRTTSAGAASAPSLLNGRANAPAGGNTDRSAELERAILMLK